MNPIEMQPTLEYSGATSMPGTSSAEGASEAWAVGPRVGASTTDDRKAPPGGHAGHQHVSFAETLKYPPTSDHEPADTYFHPQPPPYAASVQLQQPMASASATYPWDHQVPLAQGVAAMNITTAAASASGDTTVWMPKPLTTTLCPPGLEYLTELSQLHFEEEFVDMPIGVPYSALKKIIIFPRRFIARNAQGQQIYVADTKMSRSHMEFRMGFVDRTGKALMTVHFNARYKSFCSIGTCRSFLTIGTVEAPPGNVVGTVEQQAPGGNLSFAVKSTDGSPVILLEAPDPCCLCMDCKDQKPHDIAYQQFAMFSLDYEHVVGKIEAKQTMNKSCDGRWLTNFALVFPADLDVRVKATLAGAAIMMHGHWFGNYNRYSRPNQVSHRNHRTGPSDSFVNDDT